ncbi:DNA cytosine methyltransferase [soil metagenome]
MPRHNSAVGGGHLMKTANLTAIDLFSGCGGLTEGLRLAGFTVLAAVEIDDLAAETYRLNHSAHVIERDIRKVTGEELLVAARIAPGELDLLAGCPPCQGFSTLRTRGKARFVEDDRNDLVFEFLRLVEELRPKAVMMENVPNLARDETRINPILARLRELDYVVDRESVGVHDAADYDVPQRRKRMVLLATKGEKVTFPVKRARVKTVSSAFEALQFIPPDDPLHVYTVRRNPRIQRLIEAIPTNGGSRSALPPEMALACHAKTNGFRDVYGRMSWGAVSPTITSGCSNPSKGRFLHPEEHRAITLREAALLQSFRYDYAFSLRKGREGAAAMIGNAFPPEFARSHAEQIRSHLES